MDERTHVSPEEAHRVINEKVANIGKPPWMAVIFRLRGNFITMDRTTSEFPTDKLLECAELFTRDMEEEKKRTDEENEAKGYGITLPRDPLPSVPVEDSPGVFGQIRENYLRERGESE